MTDDELRAVMLREVLNLHVAKRARDAESLRLFMIDHHAHPARALAAYLDETRE